MVPHFFMNLHLPHISRIFSAKTFSRVGNLCLWVVLLALVSFNVFLWLTKPLSYSENLFAVFTHPFSAPAHEALAQTLEGTGASRERAIVAELSPVLGAATTAQAQQKEADMIFWQNVLSVHPDYRDGYVQLSALYYGEGNLMQAHADLLKAQLLDPNNAVVDRLTAFTSKLLE